MVFLIGQKSDLPVCVMNAGYSSGWCEESFGVPLVASEIMCRAKGDEACRFIMAHPSKIEGYIENYLKKKPKLAEKITKYEIPGFFKRKEAERALRESEEKYRAIFNTAKDGIFINDETGNFIDVNPTAWESLGYSKEDLLKLSNKEIDPEATGYEVFKKIASGDPRVRITEVSENEMIIKLKQAVNKTAKGIGAIVDQSHEFAIGLAEHFDVLSKVSKGKLNSRITEEGQDELLRALGRVDT